MPLDVTDPAQVERAARLVDALDVLVNNADVAFHDELGDQAVLEQTLAVSLFGTYRVTRAFLPYLTRSRRAIVNDVSLIALVPLPIAPAYAMSNAAAFNITQSLRALVARRGVTVHAALTGPTETS